jgi:hypothetical protein
MVEPNRLRGGDPTPRSGEATPPDQPISSRLPLLAGLGLAVSGLAMFAAGGTRAQTLGMGLASLGAGLAIVGRLLSDVRDVRAARANPMWKAIPTWTKPFTYLGIVGLGIGAAMLIGFAVFAVIVAALGVQA